MRINVFAVNLAYRTDRKENIVNQFMDKPEFSLTLVPAIEHANGAYGLWQTVQQIVRSEAEKESEYFILCEDDHTFTEHYSADFLSQSISHADTLGADMLSGGYSCFGNAMQVSKHLFWTDIFNGMQFTIVFRRFYQAILDADFGKSVVTDISLSGITNNKFVMYPYISIQQEFGYSDVTSKNNEVGYVDGLFKNAIQRLYILSKVRRFYFSDKYKIQL